MTANNYVPLRMETKINRETGLLMENGINAFYETLSRFWMTIQVQNLAKSEQSDLHALTMDDLKGPLLFCSYLLVFAWLVFIFEVFATKLKMRRK